LRLLSISGLAIWSAVAGAQEQAQPTLVEIIKTLGLGSDLVLVLDAVDRNSYPGSGQTWFDVSGAENHFYLGSAPSEDNTDPVFVGSPGAANAYFEAANRAQFSASAAGSFMSDWHKDDGSFTVFAIEFYPVVADASAFILANQHSADPGVRVLATRAFENDGKMSVQHFNGAGGVKYAGPTDGTVPEGSWFSAAISFQEGSGTSFGMINSSAEAFSGDTRRHPSGSNPTDRPHIWAEGDGSHHPTPGMRVQAVVAWDRALSVDELMAFHSAVKAARPDLTLP
jgi:hypothetical protein